MYILMIFTALLPALILLYLIWKRDALQREPVKIIVRAFLVGMLSVPLSMVVSIPAIKLWETYCEPWVWSVFNCLYEAFCTAAIPEELAKFAILFWFLRKNTWFDEYMDGIVYAAAISLGFAGLENIFYLVGEEEIWGVVAIFRALLSVPVHFACGVIMGYYYSLWRIDNDSKYLKYAIGAPILCHGAYDFFLMFIHTTGFISFSIIVVFFVGIHRLRKHCTLLIDQHLTRDASTMQTETDIIPN